MLTIITLRASGTSSALLSTDNSDCDGIVSFSERIDVLVVPGYLNRLADILFGELDRRRECHVVCRQGLVVRAVGRIVRFERSFRNLQPRRSAGLSLAALNDGQITFFIIQGYIDKLGCLSREMRSYRLPCSCCAHPCRRPWRSMRSGLQTTVSTYLFSYHIKR